MNRDALLAWATEQLRADHRVRGLWIAGSTARGMDDGFSDLDLLAVVTDLSFAGTWLPKVRRARPLVQHQLLDFGSTTVINHIVGDDWLRFDLLIGPAGVLRGRSRRTAKVVFDRGRAVPDARGAAADRRHSAVRDRRPGGLSGGLCPVGARPLPAHRR